MVPTNILDVGECIGTQEFWGHPYSEIVCPVCGSDLQRAEDPKRMNATDDYLGPWRGRGDLIVIPMWGECGSKWELNLGFHKGNCAVFLRVVTSCNHTGRIYFIEAVGFDIVKIGFSADPDRRLRQLATSSPMSLTLLGSFPGRHGDEVATHRRFASIRVNREWFRACDELRQFVLESCGNF